MSTYTSNLHSKYLNSKQKRIFDVIISTIIILMFFYIFLFALLKKNIIFKHPRIGKNNISFNCLKLKTMIDNFDFEKYLNENHEANNEYRQTYKLKNDPRVKNFGKILRKYSIDEIPQLLNVFKGEMSLVGPRPIIKKELDEFPIYNEIFKVCKPGLTGLWQSGNRSNSTYRERIELDCQYVNNASVKLDCLILLKTIKTVVLGRGAY